VKQIIILKDQHKIFKIDYYSYDSDRTSKESFMIEKGYPHKVWDEEKQVVDFMDGNIIKFIKHIF